MPFRRFWTTYNSENRKEFMTMATKTKYETDDWNNITFDEAWKRYSETFSNMTFEEAAHCIDEMPEKQQTVMRRIFLMDFSFRTFSASMYYGNYETQIQQDTDLQLLLREAARVPVDASPYCHAIVLFFEGRQEECLQYLDKSLHRSFAGPKTDTIPVNEKSVILDYFMAFKEGTISDHAAMSSLEFWNGIVSMVRRYPHEDQIPELCELFRDYYQLKTYAEKIDLLLFALQRGLDFNSIRELLVYDCMGAKRWHEAKAYLEQTQESPLLLYGDQRLLAKSQICFKLKDWAGAEQANAELVRNHPQSADYVNDLGYAYYMDKQYDRAAEMYQKCLSLAPDHAYGIPNTLRLLITTGKTKEAKAFAAAHKDKIGSSLIRKAEAMKETNGKTSTHRVSYRAESTEDEQTITAALSRKNDPTKEEQFSSEKLLEDELTARMESGRPVFGMKLHVLQRNGIYGRQFVIARQHVRFDLLCEDDKGDLYVIELKKDAGYDDAYAQLTSYLDILAKNRLAKGHKVYGILCLNHPGGKLLEQVHNDNRIRLFEYSITYTER